MTTSRPQGMAPLPAPFMIQLHTTNRCNQNCQFCWMNGRPRESCELPDERWLEIADEICSLRVPHVAFGGGGEPTLRPHLLLRMMERFARAGREVVLLTNGTLVTEQFAKRLVELQIGIIHVSIHAPTAALHDSLTGTKGAFDLALQGIGYINKYKQLRKSAFPQLTIRIAITKSNFSTLPGFIRLAKSLKVDVVCAKMVVGDAATKERHSLSTEEMRQFDGATRRAEGLAKKAGIVLDFEVGMGHHDGEAGHHPSVPARQDCSGASEESRGESEPACPIPFSELAIFANGTAAPCPHFVGRQSENEEQRAGWLEDLTHQSLKQAWLGGFAALRSSMSSKEGLCPTCEGCSMDIKHPVTSFFDRRFEYFRKQKRYREGLQFGLEQLREYPNSPLLYKHIGEFYRELGEFDGAILSFSRAVELSDSQGLVKCEGRLHLKLAECLMNQREYKKALESFDRALSESASRESRFNVRYLMAICHWRLRQRAKMARCLGKARELADPLAGREWNGPFFHEGFRHLRELKGYNDGIRFGLEQLKEYPDNAVLHHHIGEFHMELGEYDKAIEHLSRAVQLDPKMEWTHFSLGKCFYLTGRHCEAEKAFRRNLELTSDRLSHFHSWLFLAMIAHSINDRRACQKALTSLKDFREFVGSEIPLEQKFLMKLEQEKRLPARLKRALRM